MSETLPLSSVKARFSEVVDRVEREHDRVVVTRNGVPAVVVISREDLESLEETLEVMSDPDLMDQVRESRDALGGGRAGHPRRGASYALGSQSSGVSTEPWRVRVMAPAQRQLERLPERYAVAVLDFLPTIATNPRRLGKPLRFELEGCWVARRGPYRVIYVIDEPTRTVSVVAIAHWSDVYHRR